MALTWRLDVPDAMTMKSAMLDFPDRSMTTTSSALSSSSDSWTRASTRSGVSLAVIFLFMVRSSIGTPQAAGRSVSHPTKSH
jgi:hypothetical protein